MSIIKKIIAGWVSLLIWLSINLPVHASTALDRSRDLLNSSSQTAGLRGSGDSSSSIFEVIGLIISTLISLLGVLFVVLMVYAGFLYMTARGNEKQTQSAKSIMITATIGLVIILASYAITTFVFSSLIGQSVAPPPAS